MNKHITLTLLTCTILLASPLTQAKVKDFLKIDKIAGGSLGLWAIGDGHQDWTNLHCVASSNYSNGYTDPPPVKVPAAVHMPYQFKVKDLATPAGYYFYLDDDDANTGNSRLAVSFDHKDIKAGAAFQGLSDDIYDVHAHDGQFNKCNNGKNSEISMLINSSELTKARAGQYVGNFRFKVIGGSSGTVQKSRLVQFTIDVAQSVRISALDNIPLGAWSGTGDMNGDETFCIYSNNDSAAYNVSIASSQQDGGGNFRLANGGLSSYINYHLSFADSEIGAGVPVGLLPISGAGNNTQSDCNSGNNARLIVDILEADLISSSTDSYSDTITILVAPE